LCGFSPPHFGPPQCYALLYGRAKTSFTARTLCAIGQNGVNILTERYIYERIYFMMKVFNLKFVAIILIIVLSVFSISFLRIMPSMGIKIKGNNDKSINYLTISSDIFYRQTLNNCAPYAVMGVINILKGKQEDPEQLAQETKWRIIKNLTFPQGLIDLLHKYNIRTKEYSLKLYSNENKIAWLKGIIDNRNPIILLVKVKNIQHYFTVIGYDNNGFMLYDSLQEKQDANSRKTIIDKEEYAGNRYYPNNELIELWNRGGYKIFFRNWAVVCY
jgi:predicted double-glycine peptidase